MDGGGRLLRPITAGTSGGAVAYAGTAPTWHPAAFPFRLPTLFSRRKRRNFVSVPLGGRIPRHLGTALTLGFFTLVGATGLVAGGQYQSFRELNGELHHVLARAVGLGVERVTISGIAQLREDEVLASAGISPKVSLAFLSVNEIREKLERVPLVKSAAVRKLYPNELVVTLTEREPNALWQKNGELFVVAADGTVIDTLRDARFANLPLVVGEEANGRTKEYLALLDAAGPLRNRIRAGTLVSGRRWTLKMDGIDVRLPEQRPAEALVRLAKLQQDQRILDKDVIAIDLRMTDRVVVRLTEEAASARNEAIKKKPTRGKGVET